MTDMIPRDAAIDRLTELSCDDNAHWGAIIDALRAIPVIDPAAIREEALREAIAYLSDHGHWFAIHAIRALIGEKK